MTVAALLLVYAASVGTMGSRLLGRSRWALRAPLPGIAVYLAAAWSVVAALGLAGHPRARPGAPGAHPAVLALALGRVPGA